MNKPQKPTLSFIIPLKDEAPTLEELYLKIADQAKIHSRGWEIIFIDDGSEDDSWQTIKKISAFDPDHVRALRFRTNRSKAPALATGYREAQGEIVFTLDADLQDDPKEIPRFLEKIAEGWDIVSGYKARRHDPWHKVLPSRIFNMMLSKVNGVNLHDHNCGFKCYRSEVVKNLPMYGEMHRMVPSLAAIEGYRTTEIVVEHHARKHGVSKYGVSRFLRGFLDMWAVFFVKNYRERPLHFAGIVALFSTFTAILFWAIAFIPGIPSLLSHALLAAAPCAFFVSPICVLLGFMAELNTNLLYKDGIDVPVTERIECENYSMGIVQTASAPVAVKSNIISVNTSAVNIQNDKIPTILIADDDDITRTLSSRILCDSGWQVVTAETAEEALENINQDIDVVLLDIYFPGLSGIDAIPEIKELSPRTNIVMLSGSDKPSDGAAAIKAGAFEFLSKPVKKSELIRTLNFAYNASISDASDVKAAN